MFKKNISTSSFVQSFRVEENIYLLSDNKIQVFDKQTKEKIVEKQIFDKDGLARSFIMDKKFIYCRDFIHLHIIEKETLEVILTLALGSDLRSDICGMTMDEHNVYAGIRNGNIAAIKKGKWSEIHYYPLSKSSIWDMKIKGQRIYAGNVEGQLLSINTDSMKVKQCIQAHKMNTKSIYLFDMIIATASQDKQLILWSMDTLDLIRRKRNTHKKAFIIGGHWNGKLLTLSFSGAEMKIWDIKTLAEENLIPIRACLTGESVIDGSILYVCSRAIQGIEYADMEDIIGSCDE